MRTDRSNARIRDMTAGNPLHLILSFAIPLFIGNIFQQLYNMVDTMVVGHHLGDQAIASIAATASLYSLIVNIAGGLNNGYGIVVTQRFGSHDRSEMRQAIAGMALLNTGAAVLLPVLALIFLKPLMLFMNTPATVFEQARSYIAVIIGGMAATIGYNMFAAIMRAMGNSRSPLYFLILSSLLNIVLDVLFVMVFDTGVIGAAVATILSQSLSAVLSGVYVFRNYRGYIPEKCDFRISKSTLTSLLSTGVAMALMSTVVDLGSVIFQRANNVLGEAIITAHAAARKLLMIMLQPQATIAIAIATFVGQNWGAGKAGRIRSALKQAIGLELIWSIFAAIIIFLFGRALIQFTTGTTDPAIIENAVLSLRLHFSAFPVLGVLFCVRNAMQALGQKTAPVLSSCIELIMKILSANLLIPRLGFLGTCMTEPITWCLMVLFLSIVYFCKRNAWFAGSADNC